jgi:hypothetical protein
LGKTGQNLHDFDIVTLNRYNEKYLNSGKTLIYDNECTATTLNVPVCKKPKIKTAGINSTLFFGVQNNPQKNFYLQKSPCSFTDSFQILCF